MTENITSINPPPQPPDEPITNWERWLMRTKRRLVRAKRINLPRLNIKLPDNINWTRVFQLVSIFVFVLVIAGIIAVMAVFAWYSRDLPDPDNIVRRDGFSSKIFDRNGELLYDLFSDQNRVPVTIDQVPEYLKLATISIEDKDFYTHGGFDPKGLVRAAFVTTFSGRKQGGSTLTQQLVKNALLTSERRLSRKIREFVLAVQIERLFNKDQILQMYLNEVPYGGTAWGVAAASETYFKKPVSDLNLIESAILAGLPQRPSVYSPFSSTPTAFMDRTKHVLRRMREDGHITSDQEQEALSQLTEVKFASASSTIKAPHFVFYVIDQLEEMYGKSLVEQGGLQVVTSLDLSLHNKAQEIVTEEIEKVANLGIGNGAAMVMDSHTGEILSMVGSKNYFDNDQDGQVNVTTSLRQPGSAIKPVTYAAALSQGFTPASVIMDVRTEFPGGQGNPPYVPVNYDGNYRGPVSLRNSLGASLNVPAVKLLAKVGVKDMLGLAYDMGLSSLEPTAENLSRFGLAVTLGGGEVRLLELTTAYSSFSNGGTKVEPVAILKVTDRNKNILFENRPVEGRRVLDEKVAFLMNDILSDNNARLMTFGANSLLNMGGRPVAVKTGTTNDRRDNWTIGWSDSTIVGVWVGNNDNSPMKAVASGVSGASPIWRKIMLTGLEERPARAFEKPNGVDSVFVNNISGYPEHDGFPSRTEFVISGTLPSLPDPIHTKLKMCHGQNKLATATMIARGNYEEREFFVFREEDPFAKDGVNKWQEGINAWIATQEDQRYRPPTEYCETSDKATISIREPSNEKDYEGTEIDVEFVLVSEKEVKRFEVMVNNVVRETLSNAPYRTKLKLDPGVYEIKGRVVLADNDKVESPVSKIGVGGVSWKPAPSPSPSPSVEPSPSASESPNSD